VWETCASGTGHRKLSGAKLDSYGRAGVSPRRASYSAASPATAGPWPARSDQPAGSGHRSRPTGNTAGRHARASLACPKTGDWRIIFYKSARLCSRSSIVLVWRPPTGGQNRPSARWWSRARSGAATAPSPEPERKASWAAFCKPVASNSVLYPLSYKDWCAPQNLRL
jgi:hypothetical protein